jgi:hypothetical protein
MNVSEKDEDDKKDDETDTRNRLVFLVFITGSSTGLKGVRDLETHITFGCNNLWQD